MRPSPLICSCSLSMRLASTRFPSPTKPSLPRCSVLEKKAFDFAWTTAGEIAAAFAAGRVTALNVVEVGVHPHPRARSSDQFFHGADRGARALARAGIDDARARGEPAPPLAGVPFAVKNLFDIAGLPTLAGSKINRDAPPAGRDAALIERLEAAGAILVGALNMGEYAYDFTGENVHDGPARNPHDLTRMTGGSSGGSAAAVAGGLVPLALGSDTNGSIRVPSSLCGLFGLKPTYGRLSRARTFPFAASFDHVGPLARSARDLAIAYDAMQGHDPDDPGLRRSYGRARHAAAGPRHRRTARRRRRRLFQMPDCRSRFTRSIASRRRSAPIATSRYRKRSAPARPPTSSPRARAQACISTGCAPARRISILLCATG